MGEKDLKISLAAMPNQNTPKGIVPGRVMMHFGVPVTNISFSAAEARVMAQKLTALAVDATKTIEAPEKIDRGNKGPHCEHCGQILPEKVAPPLPEGYQPKEPNQPEDPKSQTEGISHEDSGDRPGE